jgi:ATP-dependent helicase/nuclease subunit A
VSAGLAGIESQNVGIQPKVGVQNKEKTDARPCWHDNFEFLTQQAPSEPTPSKPLTPSRLVGEMPANASPLLEKQIYAVGKYVHLLLQHLPKQIANERLGIAKILARKFAGQIAPDILEKATKDAIAIIENPEFEFLFSEKSLAEVPITGSIAPYALKGKGWSEGETITVSGQIDRLYIGEKEVWIVDFKSNQLPPKSPKDISKHYIRQLALYRLLMQQITPEKTVHCALLWTATAKLDVISDDVFNNVGLG